MNSKGIISKMHEKFYHTTHIEISLEINREMQKICNRCKTEKGCFISLGRYMKKFRNY